MQRRLPAPLLLGVLLVLASLLGAVYLGWLSGGESEPQAVAELGATPAAASSQRVPETLLRPDESGLEGGPSIEPGRVQAEAGAPVDTPPVAQWDRSRARTVEGRVAFPAGTPSDERAEVVALDRDVSSWELFHERAFPHRAWGGVVFDRVEVPSDGSFRLSVPHDQEDVFLAVRGRYAYSQGSQAATDSNNEVPVQLGAWVVGRMKAPEGALGPIDWTENSARLERDELGAFSGGVGLAEITSNASMEYEVELDADGAFEFRAVQAKTAFKLDLDSDDFAASGDESHEFEPGRRHEISAQLIHGATLSGEVRDDAGQPVAEARVRAHTVRSAFGMTLPGDTLRETTTDQEGAFQLSAVAPGKVRLRVERSGYLESFGDTLEVRDSEQRDGLSLTLSRGSRIAGIVLLPDGSPAAQAEIKARRDLGDFMSGGRMGAFGGFEGETKTDDAGTFELTGLGSGDYTVRVNYEDELEDGSDRVFTQRLTGVKPDGPDLRILLTPPLSLRGRVATEAGEAVEVFEVHARLKPANAFIPTGEASSEEFESGDGTFEMHSLYAGTWEIEVRSEGYSPSEVQLAEMPEAADESMSFLLRPVSTVTGRVLSPAGDPIASARVTLHLEMQDYFRTMMGSSEVPETTTREDGTFVLADMPSGTHSLYATHAEFAASEAVAVETQPGGLQEDVVLRMRVGGLVTGEVYDKEGELAEGQTVIMQLPTGRDQRYAQTDMDGFFEFTNVTPGGWQVIAMLADDEGGMDLGSDEGMDFSDMMSNLKMGSVDVVDGEESHVVLGAPPEDPVQVLGRVTAGGDPVDGAMISFFPADGRDNPLSSMKLGRTDEEGRFELQLDAPGPYVMNVQTMMTAVGRQQTVEFQQTVPEKETYELEVEMPAGTISGRIWGPDGEPEGSARVSLTRSDGQAWGTFMGGQYAEITADEDGYFTIQHLRPGTYSVGAGGAYFGGLFGDVAPLGRQVRDDIVVAEGKHVTGVDFHLGQSGTLKGTVRNDAGKPVAEATVFVRDESGRLLEAISLIQSDDAGRFSYTGLSEGRYKLSARTKAQTTGAEVQVDVRPGKESAADLQVTDGTMVVVNLIDKANEEVRGRITVTDPAGNEYSGMMSMSDIMSGMTNGFSPLEQRIGPLAPGTYKVTAVAQDGRTAYKSVSLSGQAERKVTIRLRD